MPSLGDDLIGHAANRRLLEHACDHPPAAFIFCGEPHLGKHLIAERFVSILLGEEISSSHWKHHPDLVLLEPEEGKNQISIEQVRAARERLAMRPLSASRLVLYIPNADRLNESGTNALLKVIEEPAAGAVAIMVVDDASRLPATLKSRSVVLPFGLVSQEILIEGLEKRNVTHENAITRAKTAHGRPGLALEPMDADHDYGTRFVKEILAAKNTGEGLYCVERLSNSCESESDSLGAWRESLSRAMQAMGDECVAHPEMALILGTGLLTAWRSVGSGVPIRIPLEASVARLSRIDSASLQQLLPGHLPVSLPLVYTIPNPL